MTPSMPRLARHCRAGSSDAKVESLEMLAASSNEVGNSRVSTFPF